jgi:hypothetical protein
MPLQDIGPSVITLTGINTRAVDQNGSDVTISASQEAIDDFGWGVIMPMASRKYDDGQFDTSNPPLVRVTAADCQQWMNDNT